MPDTVPLSRATTLIPFLNFLDELGALVDPALEQGHLPLRLREKPGCFISTKLNWDFVDEVARQVGVDDLGLRVGHGAGVSILGRHLFARLDQSRSLAQALQEFCEHAPRESTGMRCWLVTNQSQIEFHLKNTFGPAARGYREAEWLGLSSILAVIQLFLGPNWEPPSISLRADGPVPNLANELFPSTTFLAAQPRAFIAVPREALRYHRARTFESPRFEHPDEWKSEFFDESPAEGLFGALAQSLEPYLADGYPDVTLGARIADMRVRTLQRRLHAIGVTYSTVVDQARFQIASKLLSSTAKPSAEIARALGYSDASHFARAFRRLTGRSPQEYRQEAGQAD